jgi:preprotein translocase subunit SecG
MIKEFEDKFNVLTHPARRLSYDSFGLADGQYAWAFKSPTFILQTIIGSAIFFVICTFMSMMNSKKDEVKQAFKL